MTWPLHLNATLLWAICHVHFLDVSTYVYAHFILLILQQWLAICFSQNVTKLLNLAGTHAWNITYPACHTARIMKLSPKFDLLPCHGAPVDGFFVITFTSLHPSFLHPLASPGHYPYPLQIPYYSTDSTNLWIYIYIPALPHGTRS